MTFGSIDFHGQQLASSLLNYIMISGFIIGILWGYFMDSIGYSLVVWAAAIGVAIIVCVPPWPFYNRNPIKWLSVPKPEEPESEVEEKENKEEVEEVEEEER